MLFLFRHHNILPHQYAELPEGEKRLLSFLINAEIEDRNEEARHK